MGRVTTNINRNNTVKTALTYEQIVESANRLFAPLLKERFAAPVRLTKNAEKGDEVVYAIGRGPAGLVIELRNAYEVSSPIALGSFANHRPSIFEDLDAQILASLIADDPLA